MMKRKSLIIAALLIVLASSALLAGRRATARPLSPSVTVAEYQIILGTNADDEIETVQNYQADGWQCQGGISVVLVTPDTGSGATYLFSQAMVR